MKDQTGSIKIVLIGTLVGAIVLGLAGRFVMAGLAILFSVNTNLTLSGILFATLLGAVIGFAGGWIKLFFHKRGKSQILQNGVFIGIVLFFMSLVFSMVQTLFTGIKGMGLATMTAVLFLFLIYGFLFDFLLARTDSTS
jgi:hypothetical protein